MRIFLSGPHCSGKTTLARYCSEKYSLPLLPEVARMVLSEKELQIDTLRSNMEVVDDYQRTIFYRQIEEEQKHNSFVSDRSIIDCLAYSTQHAQILPELLASPALQDCLTILREPGSILFFVRASKGIMPRSDGIREQGNYEAVVSVDAIIKTFLEMWGLRYYAISMCNMQERVRLIDNIIGLYQH